MSPDKLREILEAIEYAAKNCIKEHGMKTVHELAQLGLADLAGQKSERPSRDALLLRAETALVRLEDWCEVNIAEFTGWGDGEVPPGAEKWRDEARAAKAALKGETPAAHKQTSPEISSIAAKYLGMGEFSFIARCNSTADRKAIFADVKSLSASALAQDETKGQD